MDRKHTTNKNLYASDVLSLHTGKFVHVFETKRVCSISTQTYLCEQTDVVELNAFMCVFVCSVAHFSVLYIFILFYLNFQTPHICLFPRIHISASSESSMYMSYNIYFLGPSIQQIMSLTAYGIQSKKTPD